MTSLSDPAIITTVSHHKSVNHQPNPQPHIAELGGDMGIGIDARQLNMEWHLPRMI